MVQALYEPNNLTFDFFIRYLHELGYFERFFWLLSCFTFNGTGNARQSPIYLLGTVEAGSWKTGFWIKLSPKWQLHIMSRIDITWSENLLWINIFSKKKYVMKTSWTTIMSRGDKIHIIHHWGPNYGVHIILTLLKIVSWCLGMKIASISQQIITWNFSKHVLSICVPRR